MQKPYFLRPMRYGGPRFEPGGGHERGGFQNTAPLELVHNE